GMLVTTTTTPAGLWSGALVHQINLDLAANPVQTFCWPGKNPTGTGFGGPLGSPPTPQVGSTTDTNGAWIDSGRSNILDSRPFYGISSALTVPQTVGVPEPSTVVLFGVGGISLLAYAWRRNQGAQGRNGGS